MHKPIGISLRFVFTGISIATLSHLLGQQIIQVMLPLLTFAITLFDSRITIHALGVINQHGAVVLACQSELTRPFFIGAHLFLIDTPIRSGSSIPVDFVLQPLVIFLTLVLAWPAQRKLDHVVRIGLGLPIILGLMLLDSPMQFIYMLWDSMEKQLQTPGDAHTWLMYWSDFLNGGGLIALSLSISVLAIAITKHMQPKQ
jgi:hypothetical protein